MEGQHTNVSVLAKVDQAACEHMYHGTVFGRMEMQLSWVQNCRWSLLCTVCIKSDDIWYVE